MSAAPSQTASGKTGPQQRPWKSWIAPRSATLPSDYAAGIVSGTPGWLAERVPGSG